MTQKTQQRRERPHDVGNMGIGRAGRGDGSGGTLARQRRGDAAAADAENEAEYLPGTLAAIAWGCTCGILANRFGAGAADLPLDEDGNAQYWVDASCPLHSSTTPFDPAQGSLTASNVPPDFENWGIEAALDTYSAGGDARQAAPRVGPATELEGWLCVALVVTTMAWVVVVLVLLL